MPRERVPTLVFAGRVGWMVADLMQQLRNSNFLGGKIVLVEDPSDAELEQLYQGCLFTLFPSFHEGWGLPVTESLSFGRPCIISNATSLPEAGGALARYFDPDNATEATAIIRDVLLHPEAIPAWQERVVREFRPVPWRETAEAVLRVLQRPASPSGSPSRAGRLRQSVARLIGVGGAEQRRFLERPGGELDRHGQSALAEPRADADRRVAGYVERHGEGRFFQCRPFRHLGDPRRLAGLRRGDQDVHVRPSPLASRRTACGAGGSPGRSPPRETSPPSTTRSRNSSP